MHKVRPYRNEYEHAVLLRNGHWLQKQGDQWYEFWNYGNHKLCTESEVIGMLIIEVDKTKEKWVSERSKTYDLGD